MKIDAVLNEVFLKSSDIEMERTKQGGLTRYNFTVGNISYRIIFEEQSTYPKTLSVVFGQVIDSVIQTDRSHRSIKRNVVPPIAILNAVVTAIEAEMDSRTCIQYAPYDNKLDRVYRTMLKVIGRKYPRMYVIYEEQGYEGEQYTVCPSGDVARLYIQEYVYTDSSKIYNSKMNELNIDEFLKGNQR